MTVAVVGAGVSGLALIHEFDQRSVDVVGFEADDEPGGIMQSRTVDGRVLDLGPQRLRLTPMIERLIDQLDLHDQLCFGDDDQPLYVYHDGDLRTVPLSLSEAFTTDLLSPLGKLRILKEPLTGPTKEGETVEEYLTRKFGTQAARRYFGPLYSGLYGTDPDDMLVEYSLGRALDTAGIDGSILLWVIKRVLRGRDVPLICTFDHGLGQLSWALYEANADRIHLDTPVREIQRVDGYYELHTDYGTTTVDNVVLTPPAGAGADLLGDIDEDTAETLRRFNYNPVALVYLDSGFDGDGIGALVPSDQDVPVSGLTWNASFLALLNARQRQY